MRTRSLYLAVGLMGAVGVASGQPPAGPVVEPVLPPGVRPAVPQPASPPGLPVIPPPAATAQQKQLLEHLEGLQLRLKELELNQAVDQRRVAAPFVVGRVLVAGFTPQEELRVLAELERAGVRPGLTVMHPALEGLRNGLATAGLKGEVAVLPGDGKTDRRDVRVRPAQEQRLIPPAPVGK